MAYYIVRAMRLPQEHRTQNLVSLDYLILGLFSYRTFSSTLACPLLITL